MLIPDLTLTPGLEAALCAAVDGPCEIIEAHGRVAIRRPGGDELDLHEQRRVEGVLAAHRAEPL